MGYLLNTGPAYDPIRPDDYREVGQIRLATLSNGRVVAVDVHGETDTGGYLYNVGVALIKADGQSKIKELNVDDGWAAQRGEVNVAALTNGGFVVIWSEYAGVGWGFSASVKARIFDKNGQPAGDGFTAFDDVSGSIYNSDLVTLTGGGFAIAANIGTSVYYRAFKNNGDARDDTAVVSGLSGYNAKFGQGLNGKTIVMTENGLTGEIVGKDGALSGRSVDLVDPTAPKNISNVTVVTIGNNKLLSVWVSSSGSPSYDYDIYAQVMSGDGTIRIAPFKVNSSDWGGTNTRPTAITLPDGSVVVAWVDRAGGDEDGFAIIARRIGADGTPLGEDVQLSIEDGNSYSDANFTVLKDGNLLGGWLGLQGYFYETYLQQITTELSGDARTGTKKANTITGGGDDDLIAGLSGDDVISGRKGADTLHGNKGSDTLNGQDGADILFGGSGRDFLNGGSGNDLLVGGLGNDKLTGGKGADELRGGTGNDKLFGDAGKDLLVGDAGNDRITGGAAGDILKGDTGNDTLKGGAGKDEIFGGAGDDKIFGGAGDDWIHAERGNDIVSGGSGKDTFVFRDGDSSLRIRDFDLANDILDLKESGWNTVKGRTGQEIVEQYGSVVDGDAYLTFFNGNVIRLDGVTDLDLLADQLVLPGYFF